jgi:hypothetical protein
MLGNHPITPVLLATDLAVAREFYHGKLGLQIESGCRSKERTTTPSCSAAAAVRNSMGPLNQWHEGT